MEKICDTFQGLSWEIAEKTIRENELLMHLLISTTYGRSHDIRQRFLPLWLEEIKGPPWAIQNLIDFLSAHRFEAERPKAIDLACHLLHLAQEDLAYYQEILQAYDHKLMIDPVFIRPALSGFYLKPDWQAKLTMNNFRSQWFTFEKFVALALRKKDDNQIRNAILDLFLPPPHRRGYFVNITIAEVKEVIDQAINMFFPQRLTLHDMDWFIANKQAAEPTNYHDQRLLIEFK